VTVLIVEDDLAIRQLVRDHLQDRGMQVTVAATLEAAQAAVEQGSFTVVILDLTLPDGSGLDLLDHLRESRSTAHVIILSGSGSEAARVLALGRGADDYVVKPFSVRELSARVLAVRRRRAAPTSTTLAVGPLVIDLAARKVAADGKALELTAKEFDLLAYLAARPGFVFTRDQLLRAVWNSCSEWQQAATVTEHIRRLRAKIEADPRRPRLLRTVRSGGYRLDQRQDGGEGGANAARDVPTVATGVVIHVDGRIVFADGAAGAILGYEAEAELLGRHLVELVAPGSKAAARERLAAGIAHRPRRAELMELEREDGTRVLVEVASSTVDWHGQRAGRVSLTHGADASARLRRTVTGVFSEVSEAVVVTDLHFYIRSWNAAAERLYGWAEEEALGRHVLDVLQWVGDEGELEAAWASLELKGRWHGEGRQATRDGSVISILATATLMRDDAGEPIGVVSVNRLATTARHAADHKSDKAVNAEIRRGIANDEFEVHYQPIVGLDDGRVIAVEALVRWNDPERGLLNPAVFLEAAERSGLIIELGNLVLDKACHQAAEWRHNGVDIGLAVNLSTRQLYDPGLVDRLIGVLADSGLDPAVLRLEVTETALAEELEQPSQVLERIANFGVGVSIDDFGTGWASLTHLRSFPVHALKIDASFVAGAGRNLTDTAIVRSILSLGTELGLVVVAEGIETVAQEKALLQLGCSFGQGFLYGRPTPAGDVPIHRARRLEPTAPATMPEVQHLPDPQVDDV